MDFWHKKRVLVLGHTGFKGGWLSEWLIKSGAQLCGYSLEPYTNQSLFEDLELKEKMESHISDVRDAKKIAEVVQEFQPEIIFHMASQPIVSIGFNDPVGTYETNIMGTVNVLESIRHLESIRSVVVVTSDKCYENKGNNTAFSETDRLGGLDPYSNSKACQELVVQSYRDSFFFKERGVRIATARAGNVIGGGDWALNRLIPDLVRAFKNNESAVIRNPSYTRPWQHVLDPLNGYIMLAKKLYEEDGFDYADSWNFGPDETHCIPVSEVVKIATETWSNDAKWHHEKVELGKECSLLRLNSLKAKNKLGWHPLFDVYTAIKMSMDWYKISSQKDNIKLLTTYQIKKIENLLSINI